MNRNSILHILSFFTSAAILVIAYSCSTTSNLGEDEVLYTGMKHTVYENYDNNEHFINTKAEIEAAIACAPNGAFFKSPYYHTIPYTLWIYNAFSDKKGALAKWITKTIGKEPVLMSDATPELHVSVGENILQNNGYFGGDISYKIIEGKKGTTKKDSIPRVLTSKIEYTVNMGPLYRLDSIDYIGFTDKEISLIKKSTPLIKKGDPFSVAKLDKERERIYDEFKNNGYYFFEKNYITYLADTLQVPQHVQLQVCKADSLPEEAQKPWKIGKTTFRIRRQMMEQITDTITRRSLTVEYAGKRPAVRPRVVLQDIRLRPKQMFSQAELTESASRLTTKGIFSSTDISFTKSKTIPETDSIGTIDMLIDCILDKPYDFSLSANYTQKSSGRGGPGIGAGFAKRNAFRGGEILSFNLKGNVEFQLGNKGQSKELNYDIGADLTLDMPRLLLPNWLRPHRRWYIPPSTIFSVAFETINRSGYFRRNVFSTEFSYLFKPTVRSMHKFTPLNVSYSYLAYWSDAYTEKMTKTGLGLVSMSDFFIPRIQYTYSYTSKSFQINPITLSLSFTEAGNLTTGILSLCSNKKHLIEEVKMPDIEEPVTTTCDAYVIFNTPVTQHIKLEADFVKSWRIGTYSNLLAHVFAGYLYSYGNNAGAPFSELYYAGGANDLRGFSTRGVGPGNFYTSNTNYMYMLSNGDLKVTCNLEYRPRLFGSLYGALFIDAGNVWNTEYKDANTELFRRCAPNFKHLGNDIAVSSGIGIRYDLDFFVLRLDWGFIVHAPYDTGRSGYFNFPSFKKGQCLNFAIGYPF